jgi:hypothetical protein
MNRGDKIQIIGQKQILTVVRTQSIDGIRYVFVKERSYGIPKFIIKKL